ncbi:indolepyruvate ferredoxin oxidoreductase subunit alpha [Oscillospiraceae bacterium LTW-04]|nr:4Fe-4S binding protein [Oscillospiraceae bacterium MB24-C1]
MAIELTFHQDLCKGCALCVSVCPKHILTLDNIITNAKGYHPVACIDESQCIGCASCARICPDSIITIKKG